MSRFLSMIGLALVLVACSQQGSSTPSPKEALAGQEAAHEPQDLAELIDRGLIELVQARGNGASSGNAVDGALRNTSSRPLKVDIVMDRPLFFRNGGVGQNMIGAMVLLADGGYVSDGRYAFLELPASGQTPVSFYAYCADFEKDNPASHEHFTLDDPPPDLMPVMDRIAAHLRRDPNDDNLVAAQVGIWLAQGVTPAEIAEKYEYTAADLALARQFAGR